MRTWLPRVWLCFLLLYTLPFIPSASAEGWDPWRQDPVKNVEAGPASRAAAPLPRTFAPVFDDGSTSLQANRLADASRLLVGQVLVVPGGE